MKNGLLVLNVVLTLAVGYLLVMQFSKKKNITATGKSNGTDTLSIASPFRIAYFEMDSIEANFLMVKEIKADISKKEEDYNYKLNQIDQTYKDKYQGYLSQNLTPAQSEAAQNDLRQTAETLKNQKQQLDQQYQDFVMRSNLKLKNKVEEFLKEYNKTKKYSYIVSYEQGLFYYKDSAYNITADVIRGLNEDYKTKKP